MRFADVNDRVGKFPYIDPVFGKILYDFILEAQPAECLELGFAHGKSSCYTAAALDELGRGHLTSVDLQIEFDPPIEELLAKIGLQSYVTIVREKISYTYFLKRKIEEMSRSGICEPIYDFCFVDGPKHWVTDGLTFFLVDKLLKPNGWILFDDYNWTYSKRVKSLGIEDTDAYFDKLQVDDPDNTFANLGSIKAAFSAMNRHKPRDRVKAWIIKIGSAFSHEQF